LRFRIALLNNWILWHRTFLFSTRGCRDYRSPGVNTLSLCIDWKHLICTWRVGLCYIHFKGEAAYFDFPKCVKFKQYHTRSKAWICLRRQLCSNIFFWSDVLIVSTILWTWLLIYRAMFCSKAELFRSKYIVFK